MQDHYEYGLVKQYVKEIQGLAGLAQEGEIVEDLVQASIKDACLHLSNIASTTPAANLAAFSAQLRFCGALPNVSPAFKNTFELAASLIPLGG